MSVNTLSATVNLSEQEKHCIESLRAAVKKAAKEGKVHP
jgi:hypothetical protein